ncbi:MAG TPA: hypothetical protein QF564_21190 [Pirellulaceae bacterium]|nr:hypothetical protein [Pirellulaceae bacterium]
MSADVYCERGNTGHLPSEFDGSLEYCPLCESPAIKHYDHDTAGCRVDCCQQCHLLFMNPRFTDRYLEFLSIGCYDGIELLLVQRQGWTPEGYDVDEATMELLRHHDRPQWREL